MPMRCMPAWWTPRKEVSARKLSGPQHRQFPRADRTLSQEYGRRLRVDLHLYWLCDLCESQKIPFVLGHALYLKAIHAGKVRNDKLDSEKLAYLLRGGNFPVAYSYPAPGAGTRDLSGDALHLVRRRGETLTHITHSHYQLNLPPTKKLAIRQQPHGVRALPKLPGSRHAILYRNGSWTCSHSTTSISRTWRSILSGQPRCTIPITSSPANDSRVGRIIAMTCSIEIHTIKRFATSRPVPLLRALGSRSTYISRQELRLAR